MNTVARPLSGAFESATLIGGRADADRSPAQSAQAIAPSDARLRQAHVKLFSVPHRLDATLLPSGISEAEPGEQPDIVVLTEPNASALVARRLGAGAAAIIPVVDASCRRFEAAGSRVADLVAASCSPEALAEAIDLLRPAVRRLRSLPREVKESSDPRLMLLARLFVRGRALIPRSEIRARETFVYDDEAAAPGAAAFAEQLATLGLMSRQFFDKFNICPHCASARMTLREYCPACGSADICEQPVIHHMKCAYQGPERDFRRGDDLVCPKCSQRLKNFNVDYDRPGSIGVCLGCGHLSAEQAVGFRCLDCGSRTKARDVDCRTIYAYELTEAGRACIVSGSPLPDAHAVSVGARVREFAMRHCALRQPCCILLVRLRKPHDAPERGDSWGQTCAFFGRLMRECFTPETVIIESPPNFIALLERDQKAEVELQLPEIRERLECHLSLAPALDLAVFAPDEIPRIEGRQS